MSEARIGEILERATAFFENALWGSRVGESARDRLQRNGLAAETLRAFRVGYAPGRTRLLLEHLREAGFTEDEVIAAGLATPSEREYAHVLFHARIMFPIRDGGAAVLGFAGLATHLGPSWPLWLTSPDGDAFATSRSLFGLGEAADTIRQDARALVLRDPVQALALHQRGRRDAVAVIHSPITREHLSELARTMGIDRHELHLARRDGSVGVVVVPDGAEVAADAFAERSLPAGFSLIDSPRPAETKTRAVMEDQESEEEPPPARAIVYVAGVLIGTGIPVGALLAADTSVDPETGPAPAFSIVILGIAGAYLVLAVAVARISAHVRAQSTERRMRFPWARGRDEVQPAGWTYHRMEEILVGAALVSLVLCMVLLITLGGFLG